MIKSMEVAKIECIISNAFLQAKIELVGVCTLSLYTEDPKDT